MLTRLKNGMSYHFPPDVFERFIPQEVEVDIREYE